MKDGDRALRIGGRLSIDFANVATLPAARPATAISWEELIAFLEAARIVTAERGGRLRVLPQADPGAAEELLLQANRLRVGLRHAFSAMANGKRVAAEWVEPINAALARSAAEILAEESAARLRICANPSCSLFFYDDSRTRRRRWCTMTLCGNRSKVAAFARRQHGRRQGA